MKILTTIFAVLLLNMIAYAQAPQKMSYQAVVRNNNNALVTGTKVGMRISILQGSADGQAVYVEQQAPTTNANGLVTIEIGGGTVVSGVFVNINWANGPYFVKTETDPLGGTAYSITGTSQMLSVPYALHAKTAETVIGGAPLSHYVGELYGGGVVFYVYRDANGVEHGLIVSPKELNLAVWDPTNKDVASTLNEWDGLSNTLAIISVGGASSSAAGLCGNATQGGQTDWYLPSVRELDLLHQSLFNVNKTLLSVANFDAIDASGARYWSSTQYSDLYAYSWSFNLYEPHYQGTNKDSFGNVRAIRAY